MRHKKLQLLLLGITTMFSNILFAQLFIDQATFTIQAGATVTVQGDLTSNTDIQGAGKIVMKGTAKQNINMGGFTLPNLEIDNTSNTTLTGAAKISGDLLFTNGKIILGANNLTLTSTATTTGAGAGKFVETNSNGQLVKLLTADVNSVELPVGAGSSYRPAFVTTTGTYSNANVGVRVLAVVEPNAPPKISDYLLSYWPVTKAGITGTVIVSGQYMDAADVSGTEANLVGYFFNGTDWSSSGETHNAATNRVTAPISTASGNLYGMDKFVLAKTKVFLQGAYNTSTGVMSDALRTPTNLIPLSDPYRVAPYNFTQVSNLIAETAAASVFTDQASTNDNIVDWVFLELRSNGTNPGNKIEQTRSALIKRDGTIVDIDGRSPVTFNNTLNGSYTIAIRHRNHLGISADPGTNLLLMGEQKSTAPLLDLTTAIDGQIFGTTAAYTMAGNINLMWAGNANHNANVRYTGIQNDKDAILSDLGGAPSLTGYYRSDINMNRIIRYSGIQNDKDFLLSSVLATIAATTRTQQLPQ